MYLFLYSSAFRALYHRWLLVNLNDVNMLFGLARGFFEFFRSQKASANINALRVSATFSLAAQLIVLLRQLSELFEIGLVSISRLVR